MLFPEKCLNFGENYVICGKLLGISGKFFSYLGKTVVCTEKFFDPPKWYTDRNFFGDGGGGGVSPKKTIFKCPFFWKSAPQSLAPPTFRSFLRPWFVQNVLPSFSSAGNKLSYFHRIHITALFLLFCLE